MKISPYKKLGFTIWLVIIGTVSFSNDIRYYNFNKYNQLNGLSSYNVKKVIEDPLGFIWIATQDGLNKFDGKTFYHYNKSAEKNYQLAGNDITDLAIDKKRNYLWVASATGGINAIDLADSRVKISLYGSEENFDLTNDWILSLKIIDNELWIGTSNGLSVYNITQNKITHECQIPPTFKSNTSFMVTQLFTFKQSVIAFIKDHGILMYNINSKQIESELSTENNIYIHAITELKDSSILIATDKGICQLSIISQSKKQLSVSYYLPFSFVNIKNIKKFKIDNKGDLWLSNDMGLFVADNINQKTFMVQGSKNLSELESKKNINDIFFDRNNNIWLSCIQAVLVASSKPSPFKAFSSFNNGQLPISRVFSVIADKSKKIIYISTETGIYKYDVTKDQAYNFDHNNIYYSTFFFKDSVPVFCSTAGLKVINTNKNISAGEIFPELKSMANETIGAVERINDSIMILTCFTANKGIWILNLKSKQSKYVLLNSHHYPNKATQNNAVYIDNKKIAWIACNQGIFRFDGKNIKEFQVTAENSNKQFDLFFDIYKQKDEFLISCYGEGILVVDTAFRLKKKLTIEDGLSNNGVYNFFPIDDRYILVSSNNGLSKIDCNDYSVKSYYEQDGLLSNSLELNFTPRNGNDIFLNSINGFTRVIASSFGTNFSPPKVYFKDIRLQTQLQSTDFVNTLIEYFSVPPGTLQTTVFFSGINFPNPDRVVFAYKINELHSTWISLGTQNFVSIVSLPPGKYHLQVKASNEDGIWSTPKEIILIFPPKWYQTWWFKVLMLLTVIAAVYGLYKFRINHLKKEEKIRNQVASDLHDELGSTLNSVKVFTNLAMMEENKTSHLEKIKEATQSAISGVKDIIWVLDDKRDTIDHLLNRINQFARPICEAAGISYNQQSGGNENYKLGKEEKRNLYMIIKETINNSIKYSECSVIELLVKNKGGKINITVSDNGKGFDKEKTNSGYGLKNIIRRAEEIGYYAEINSSQGNGTLIYLEKK